MNKTKIEWVRNPDGSPGYTWNPTTGCTKGCEYCYARRAAENRLRGRFGYPADEPFRPIVRPERFAEPLQVRTPSAIFVDSMGDLFDPAIPDIAIARVWWVMGQCVGLLDPTRYRGHTFMILTKQPERMARWLNGWVTPAVRREWIENLYAPGRGEVYDWQSGPKYWPDALPDVWLGVTCENQQVANERIPHLLATPAAVRFVSVEPMLGPVDLCTAAPCGECGEPDDDGVYNGCRGGEDCLDESWWSSGIHWVIVGQQTGPGATPPERVWVQEIADACRHMRVPLFLKDNLNWPERIQEFPQGGDVA